MPQINWASVEQEFDRATGLLLQESMNSFAFPASFSHSFVSSDPERTPFKRDAVRDDNDRSMENEQLVAELQRLQQQVSHLHTTHIPALVEQAVHTAIQRMAKQLHEDIHGRVEEMVHARVGRLEAKLQHSSTSVEELFQRVADAEKALQGQLHANKQSRSEMDDARALIERLQTDLAQLRNQQSHCVTVGTLQDLGLADVTQRHSELVRSVEALNSKIERMQADVSSFRGQLDTFVHEAVQTLQQQPQHLPASSRIDEASGIALDQSFASTSMSFIHADPSARLGRLLGDGLKSYTLKCVRQNQFTADAQSKSEVLQDLMALDQTVRAKLQQNEARVQDMLSTMRDSLEHQNQLISRRMNEYCTHAEYRELRGQIENLRLSEHQLTQEMEALDQKMAKLRVDMNAHVVDTSNLQNFSGGNELADIVVRVGALEGKHLVLEDLVTTTTERNKEQHAVDASALIAETKKSLGAALADHNNRISVVEGQCERLYNELEALQTQTDALEASQPRALDSLKKQFVKVDEFHRLASRMESIEDELQQLESETKPPMSSRPQSQPQPQPQPQSQPQSQSQVSAQPPLTPKRADSSVRHDDWSREADKVIESMRRQEEMAAGTTSGSSSSSSDPATASSRSETVQCSFCLRRIARASLSAHQETCELRMDTCKHCGSRVLAIKMGAHLKSCSRRLLL